MYRAEYLYKHIDQLVDDSEVFPICVPTYNRPNARILRYVDKIPLVLCIRREQQELYREYEGRARFCLLDNVYDIGTTRAAIVDWAYNEGIDNIFMLDDDVYCLTFLEPGKSSTSDNYFMRMYVTNKGLPQTVELYPFKMWVWMLKRCSEKVTLSGAGGKPDTWSLSNADKAVLYNSASIIQCIHLNVKNLKENNINYQTNLIDGAEDYSLQYKIMSEDLYTALFKDLVFCVSNVGDGKGGNQAVEQAKMEERYHKYIKAFNDNVLDKENAYRVTTKVSKSGIPSVKYIWSKWRIQDDCMQYTIEDIKNELREKGVSEDEL